MSDLLFLGCRRVGDLDLGVCVTAEGTVMVDHARMVIRNPRYRVEPDTGALTWTRALPPTGPSGPTKE